MILPTDFTSRMCSLLGDEYAAFEQSLDKESPVSIRINTAKWKNIPGEDRVLWSQSGYYLPERLTFTFDPLFHAGGYYVQEASSMFLEQVIRTYVQEPVRCLDLCAAPGGKSTHLLSTLPEGSLLVSNEVIRSRSHILAENMIKWGNPYHIVINNDPEEIGHLTDVFDVIVADVPCSGEGMFRKDPASIGEWSIENVDLCAARQRRIVHDIWNALAPGGLFIYSTCTYNTREDEENIQYMVEEFDATPLEIPLKEEWNISSAVAYENPVYRFLPHKTRGEGFFLAALRKPDGERREVRYKPAAKKERAKNKSSVPEFVKDWIIQHENFRIDLQGDSILAFPAAYYSLYIYMRNSFKVLSAGIRLGDVKGKDLIPSHTLAMSTYLKRDQFRLYEVDWENAIRYVRKDPIVLPEDMAKGYVLLTYQNLPLGFVKNLGNRSNNLYPAEWRIRSGYLPEELRILSCK